VGLFDKSDLMDVVNASKNDWYDRGNNAALFGTDSDIPYTLLGMAQSVAQGYNIVALLDSSRVMRGGFASWKNLHLATATARAPYLGGAIPFSTANLPLNPNQMQNVGYVLHPLAVVLNPEKPGPMAFWRALLQQSVPVGPDTLPPTKQEALNAAEVFLKNLGCRLSLPWPSERNLENLLMPNTFLLNPNQVSLPRPSQQPFVWNTLQPNPNRQNSPPSRPKTTYRDNDLVLLP
jgi:hypothetical protein